MPITTTTTHVITGGTRGIGRSLALQLAAPGVTLALVYRSDDDAAEETADEIERRGGQGVLIKADLREPGAAATVVEELRARVGGVDSLVANAASSAFKPLLEIREHHIEKTMGLTLASFLDLTRGLLPFMRPDGRVLAISGWDSFRMLPGHGLLGAAKAALETMVKYLALELAEKQVTAIGLAPGPVDTDSFRIYGGETWDDYNREWSDRTPVGRIAGPDDLAPILAFLLTPEARWFNGQTLVADGGLSLATMAPEFTGHGRGRG